MISADPVVAKVRTKVRLTNRVEFSDRAATVDSREKPNIASARQSHPLAHVAQSAPEKQASHTQAPKVQLPRPLQATPFGPFGQALEESRSQSMHEPKPTPAPPPAHAEHPDAPKPLAVCGAQKEQFKSCAASKVAVKVPRGHIGQPKPAPLALKRPGSHEAQSERTKPPSTSPVKVPAGQSKHNSGFCKPGPNWLTGQASLTDGASEGWSEGRAVVGAGLGIAEGAQSTALSKSRGHCSAPGGPVTTSFVTHLIVETAKVMFLSKYAHDSTSETVVLRPRGHAVVAPL
mmetsp:Transcript_9335/g.30862  ORF Transcript_9335/g.30862 Transcript_9335/m.30862 type:complete len:289 (+) Transcript_9335:4351-5217(+)